MVVVTFMTIVNISDLSSLKRGLTRSGLQNFDIDIFKRASIHVETKTQTRKAIGRSRMLGK